jgi:CRP-like cAMP-binding protein
MERELVAQVFRGIPLFRSLRQAEVNRLAGLASVRAYRDGATIVRQDDTAITLYCVLSGKVRVVRQSASSDGAVLLAEMGTGAVFGEMALLDDFPRSATVQALEPTQCALLSKWDFQKELRAHPEIGLELLRTLSRRVRELDAQIAL